MRKQHDDAMTPDGYRAWFASLRVPIAVAALA